MSSFKLKIMNFNFKLQLKIFKIEIKYSIIDPLFLKDWLFLENLIFKWSWILKCEVNDFRYSSCQKKYKSGQKKCKSDKKKYKSKLKLIKLGSYFFQIVIMLNFKFHLFHLFQFDDLQLLFVSFLIFGQYVINIICSLIKL